ncbi:MAG: aldo/keto reductase [Anaeromyxobacter sp.]|nr:aldo/keto reductase [Anaeromyxobacter sp.]MBL0277514.1 aldo/keto reductase [Anaeromyxobacter sp.]
MPTSAFPGLADYSLLGRSGLRVSPLCLGTMTFGTEWGWGADEATARSLFRRYVEAGGNFIDTADLYVNGRSEELLGTFMKDAGNRHRLVVASKFTFNAHPGDPNAGGNGRKNILRALEGSLRRLGTDYLDLYWLHAWDGLTPAEEVMATFDALVRSGTVRHVGLSDVPAWYLARAQTLAEWRGWEPVAALQLEYSLVERTIEREFVPAALELGAGICGWSPLGGGFLTGKYQRAEGTDGSGAGRLQQTKGSGNPVFVKFTERNWRVLEVLRAVAAEVGRSPAQVALSWITRRPGVSSTIVGATTLGQLEDNLGALSLALPAEAARRLEEASRPDPGFPYAFFTDAMRGAVTGGTSVRAEPPWFRAR